MIDGMSFPCPPAAGPALERLSGLLDHYTGLEQRFRPITYVEALEEGRERYKQIPDAVVGWEAQIASGFGPDAAELFHQKVMLLLMSRFARRASRQLFEYPESVLATFERFFSSILRRIDAPLSGAFRSGVSGFEKDLGVCAQRLIPCGAQVIDRASAIPKSFLLKQGPIGGLSMARFAATTLGGLSPLYQMHMDSRTLLLEFNPRGWDACYRRIAEMLQRDTAIRGVFGTAWWFDPAVASVSPRLAFINQLPCGAGARVFPMGTDATCTSEALKNAPQRLAAFERGTYKPMRYTLVWSRHDLLTWVLMAQQS